MKGEAAVVIPYYHSQLTELEKLSYKNCLDVLKKHPIILVVPEKISKEVYSSTDGVMYEVVPDWWMESISSYNQMMVSNEFYSRFIKYKYILIFQFDAFVFGDLLEEFCNYDYDYIGAPWLTGMKYLRTLEKGIWYVGNGGFSLRNVSAFLNILEKEPVHNIDANEDAFWASWDSEYFRVAPVEIALKFAFEKDVRQCFLLNNYELPFGCHAWEKYDFEFWKPIFEKMGYYLQTSIPEGLDRNNNTLNVNYSYLEAEERRVQLCLNRFAAGKETTYCVFGAGRIGKECCWLLQHIKVQDVRCVDNNRKLWGSSLWKIQIESPKILEKRKDNIIIIIAAGISKRNEILEQIEDWGYIYRKNVFLYSDLINCIKAEELL